MPLLSRLSRTIAVAAAAACLVAAGTTNERAVQKAFNKAIQQYWKQSASYETYARRFADQMRTKLSQADDKGNTPEQIRAIANAAILKLETKGYTLVDKIFQQQDRNVAKLTALKASENDFVQLGYIFGDSTGLIVQLTSDITIGLQETAEAEIAD